MLEPILQVLGTRFGARLEVAGPALANIIGPHNRLRFCIDQRDARGLRPFNARTVREKASGDFAASRFRFLLNRSRAQDVISGFLGLDDLRRYALFDKCASEIRFKTILWRDVDLGISTLRVG